MKIKEVKNSPQQSVEFIGGLSLIVLMFICLVSGIMNFCEVSTIWKKAVSTIGFIDLAFIVGLCIYESRK